MEKFIGVKIVKAKPMTRGDYNDYRGWQLPADEDGSDEGCLVEHVNSPNSNHPNHEGYISWSPKEQFEEANRPINGMTFGHAIEAMKTGLKVSRKGWNGKGIFIYIPSEIGEMTNPYIAINTTGLLTKNEAAPKCVVPWLASQTDMLAKDWCIVE